MKILFTVKSSFAVIKYFNLHSFRKNVFKHYTELGLNFILFSHKNGQSFSFFNYKLWSTFIPWDCCQHISWGLQYIFSIFNQFSDSCFSYFLPFWFHIFTGSLRYWHPTMTTREKESRSVIYWKKSFKGQQKRKEGSETE